MNIPKYLSILVLLPLLHISSPVFAQLTPQHEKDIRRLMELTEVGKTVEAGSRLLLSEQINPEGPIELYNAIKARFKSELFIEAIVLVHAKYWSHSDTRALIAFYSTPLGKKMTSIQPKMIEDFIEAGLELMVRVSAEYYYEKSKPTQDPHFSLEQFIKTTPEPDDREKQ